jgi:hypothetical protein
MTPLLSDQKGVGSALTQHITPPPITTPPESGPQAKEPGAQQRLSRDSIFLLLIFVALLFVLFTGLFVRSLPQAISTSVAHPTPSSRTPQDPDSTPLAIPGHTTVPPLTLPVGQYLVYEQQNNIYVASTTGGTPQSLLTPGYIYNAAVPPLLTPAGQILYSGDGIWLTDIFGGSPRQIASLPAGQILTSLVLSKDGSTIAWSTEPLNGNGFTDLYLGSLRQANPQARLLYRQPAGTCPCFRAFAFLEGPGNTPATTLLLTDDDGDHTAIRNGLWSLNVQLVTPSDVPYQLLTEDDQQGPLALLPQSNLLLYASAEGVVPVPTDESVPADEASLNYANSLALEILNTAPHALPAVHTIVPPQDNLSNSANYHWFSTPLFSPDGHTLLYLEFSSDAQAPFDRHYAVYSVQFKDVKGTLQVSKPHLIATSVSSFVELGTWLNSHIVTFSSDNILYALDIQTGGVATLVQTQDYAHAFAAVELIQP